MMFQIALYEPEIAPNTGNIIRLCANTGCQLHLIHPLGFTPTDTKLQRAGLDYHDWARIRHHDNYDHFLENLPNKKIYALSTKGTHCYSEAQFQPDDILLFGPESRGLPKIVLELLPAECILRVPMMPNNRSLNLSNTVAIVTYEAWRQQKFVGS